MIKRTLIMAILSLGFGMPSSYAAPLDDHQNLTYQLLKMESPAEDMLDAIDSHDMKQLHALYQALKVSMNHINHLNIQDMTQSKNIALQNSWFDLMSLEMKEGDDMPALANAINQFSGQLIITTHFKHAHQKDIAWMDYLGREILLLNQYPSLSDNHLALLQVRKNELQTTWNRMMTFIAHQKDGQGLIQKVNPTMQSIFIETDSKSLVILAKDELELVDTIEEFFHL